MKRKNLIILPILLLTGCMSAREGSFDNATVLHWENNMVTIDQFVRDHKACLGANATNYNSPRSSISKFFSPSTSLVQPKWDGLWVTFQSNEYSELGQRLLISEPSNISTSSLGRYRKCMFLNGYELRVEQ